MSRDTSQQVTEQLFSNMIHRTKRAISTLLVLYEIFITSKATESINAGQQILPEEVSELLSTTTVSTMTSEIESTTENEETTTRYRHSYTYNRPVLPHFHLSDSRFGPFFEEGSEVSNVTARVGSTIILDCRIGLLGDKTVTWTHQRNQSINLLTVGRSAYSKDERIHLAFRYPNNYRLQISYITRRDEGMYECQVATHPPKIKRIFLKITAPEVKIVDESGRKVQERYYRAGSSLFLTCLANSIGLSFSKNDSIISWKRGDTMLVEGISLNVSKDIDSAVSTLTITPLERSHSGNYTCAVGNLALTAVAVHVLNGELPAAVQTAGAVRISTNFFLIMQLFIYAQRR